MSYNILSILYVIFEAFSALRQTLKRDSKMTTNMHMQKHWMHFHYGLVMHLVSFKYVHSSLKCLTNIYIDNEKNDEKDDQPALEEVKRRKGTKKDLWKLEVDKEGNLMLPTLDECPKREDLKNLIRSMATKAYSKHFRNLVHHSINHSCRETFQESPFISAMGFTTEKSRGVD